MIIDIDKKRFKITKLRKKNPLGIYLVEMKRLDVMFPSYRPLFYAATRKVAAERCKLTS